MRINSPDFALVDNGEAMHLDDSLREDSEGSSILGTNKYYMRYMWTVASVGLPRFQVGKGRLRACRSS